MTERARVPLSPVGDGSARLDPRVVAEAARWLVLLQTDESSEQQSACRSWRQARPENELAWQRVAQLSQDFRTTSSLAPPRLAAQTLNVVAARRSRRTAMKLALGMAGLGTVMWTVQEQVPWRAMTAQHRTRPGERETFVLEDGTVVALNSGSAIDVRFTDTLREIVLRAGEILVTTGQDARARPLFVQTVMGSIRPVGTRFLVRQRDDLDDVLVSVLEGAVELKPMNGTPPLLLHAREQASFTRSQVDGPQPLPVRPDAWVDGMLVASRMRMDDFLGELARHRRGMVRCDPKVAGQLVTGAFPLADTDRVLQMLEEVLPVRVSYRTPYWVTVSAR